jgi:quercetin dioxygenase-like cupin family protein
MQAKEPKNQNLIGVVRLTRLFRPSGIKFSSALVRMTALHIANTLEGLSRFRQRSFAMRNAHYQLVKTRKQMHNRGMSVIACLSTVIFFVSPAGAEQQALTRATLQSIDYPNDDYVTESVLVTIAPQGVVRRHTHPGVEMGYVISGAGTLSVDGAPVRSIKAGDSFAIPEGVVHGLRNTGDEPERIVSTYVVKKAMPLATLAR